MDPAARLICAVATIKETPNVFDLYLIATLHRNYPNIASNTERFKHI